MANLKISQIKIKVGQFGSCIGTFYNNGVANVMIVDSVFVEKKFRRKGIGLTVMKKALSVARKKNVDSIELVVNQNNVAAKRLYRKVGFKKTGKEYYRLILHKFK